MEIVVLDEKAIDAVGYMCAHDSEVKRREYHALTQHVHTAARLMLDRMGISLAREVFPRVVVCSDDLSYCGYYGAATNTIHIREYLILPNGGVNGSTLGEELIHWIHITLNSQQRTNDGVVEEGSEQVQEKHSVRAELWEEFIGYLGRQVYFDIAQEHGWLSLFPDGPPSHPPRSRTLRRLRIIREQMRSLMSLPPSQRVFSTQAGLSTERRSTLIHQRPYMFAAQCDWKRIHNWHTFFRLTPEEGIRRLFRAAVDQDFSGLDTEGIGS